MSDVLDLAVSMVAAGHFTRFETKVLLLLAKADSTISGYDISDALYPKTTAKTSDTIRVVIHNIRKKFIKHDVPLKIISIEYEGYRLEKDVGQKSILRAHKRPVSLQWTVDQRTGGKDRGSA